MNTDIYKLGYGYPENKRKSYIKEKIEDSNETQSLEYKGKLRKLNVIEVPIELPVYRIKNIRTKNLQKEWLVNHPDRRKDLFINDPFSIETQEDQHMILEKLIKDENLLNNFESGDIKQTENIIVSDDGVVVNGNRRLAAWRKLYYQNQDKYKHFQTINVAVLPDHDEDAIYDLEVALQIAPELKSEYKWHAEAADLKEKLDNNYDIEILSRKQKKTKDAINMCVDCYEYAQEYLESIGHPDEWSYVDEKEYAFEKIVKGRRSIKNPGEKELFSRLSDFVLSVKAEGGRLYDVIPKIATNIDKISEDLVEKYDIDLSDNSNIQNPFMDKMDIDIDDVNKATISNEISDKEPTEIVEIVRNVIKNNEDLEKEKKKKSFVFDQVKKASSNLQNAIDNLDDSMLKDGVDKQLENINGFVMILKDWIK